MNMPTPHEVARMNGPESEPVKIDYKRWKHKERGHIVEVFQVLNFLGKHGYHTVVVVEEQGKPRRVTWPAKTFLRIFQPYGRRMRRLSRWDWINREE